MQNNLVIVESPAKAKTIEKFLGSGYKVLSSYGHIRDLKQKAFSIDIENNFKPIYEIPEDKKIRDISKKERRHMIELMKNFEMHITGVRGFNEAIVTRGGVNVKEINPSTMESKKVKHLFFAGEMMDLDAVTGGYNLQIAWTTGYVAGKNA